MCEKILSVTVVVIWGSKKTRAEEYQDRVGTIIVGISSKIYE